MWKKNEEIKAVKKEEKKSVLVDESENVINKVREIFGSDVYIEKIIH